jgi:hypothetical protein
MRKIYTIDGRCFRLCDVIIGDDRVQGKDWDTGIVITVFKTNISYIEG